MYQKPFRTMYRGPRVVGNPWPHAKQVADHKKAQKLVVKFQQTSDKETKKKILEFLCQSYWDLISSCAHEFSSDITTVEDLIGCGYEALIRSASKFDLTKKTSWITFLMWNVRGSMHHYMRDKAHLVRQPAKFYDLAPQIVSRLQSIESTDRADLPKVFNEEELLTVREYEVYYNTFSNMGLTTTLHEEEQDFTETELLQNHNVQIEFYEPEAVNEKIFLQQLQEYLSEEEYNALYLCCIQNMSKNRAAKELGISNYILSRLLERSLNKARKFLGITHEDVKMAVA